MNATAPAEKLLTPAQAAVRAGRCEKTVRAWIAAGKLTATRIAGRIYIPTATLDALLAGAPVAARPTN